jgi:hypothetical protein
MRRILLPAMLIGFFVSTGVHAQCDPPLDAQDDGSGAFGAEGLPAIVISEIKPGPGGYIELFNTTNGDFNTTGYWFCSPFIYEQVSVLVPAGSYKTFPGRRVRRHRGGRRNPAVQELTVQHAD